MNTLEKKEIMDLFSKMPFTYSIESFKDSYAVFTSLDTFFSNLNIKKIIAESEMNQLFISYQSSPFHFFQYFLSASTLGFIVFSGSTFFYGCIKGKKQRIMHVSSPFYKNEQLIFNDLHNLLMDTIFDKILKKLQIKKIILRDVSNKLISIFKKSYGNDGFTLKNVKEIPYALYDINKTLSLRGKNFSNLRWHLNTFKKQHHTIKSVDRFDTEKALYHLIGLWRRHAIKNRNFSFTDIRSDKLWAKTIAQPQWSKLIKSHQSFNYMHPKKILFRVLTIDGKTASFHLGYPLGFNEESQIFAHAIGITDPLIPHLSEYAQIDFWRYLSSKGYRYVNDGPSWRKSLVEYKIKYRPIKQQNLYWMTLSIS